MSDFLDEDIRNLKIFHALNHPMRLKILAYIYDECKAQEVQEALDSLFNDPNSLLNSSRNSSLNRREKD